MDTLPRSETALGARSYVDFVPSSEWVSGEGSYTVSLKLPGFKKDQLRVQLDNYGNLCTSGERPLKGNRWSRFRKEFRLPYNCNASEIRTKFENGILTITLPKLFTEAEPVQGKCGVGGLVVAAVVMMGVGIYVAYKFRKIAEALDCGGAAGLLDC